MATVLSIIERQESDTPELFAASRNPRRWFPVGGMAWSVLAHAALFVICVAVPWNYWLPSELPPAPYEFTPLPANPNEPLLLPTVLPARRASAPRGKEGSGTPGRGGQLAAPAAAAARTLIHKGPQVIVSNPPKPDNTIQTVRQPDLVKAPRLPEPLPLPNLVSIAPSVPRLHVERPAPAPIPQVPERKATDLRAMASTVAAVPPPPELTVENPKLEVSLPTPAAPPKQPEKKVETAATPQPATASKNAHADTESSAPANSTRNILVVSAIPMPTREHMNIPPGELSGVFAVSPAPPPASSEHGTGVANGTSAGTAVAGNGTAPVGIPGGRGTGSGTEAGIGGGNANGRGKGSGGTGTAGTGTGHSGTGKGSGGGTGNGTGTGNGIEISGGGNGGPFSGITIQGGGGVPAMPRAAGPTGPPAKYTYGMTVVASASSGGGLKDYGVFHNEPVYTVYVDMTNTPGRSWTLQYAVLHTPGDGQNTPAQGIVSPPYPLARNSPHFLPELAERFDGRMIVIQGVINAEGKLDKLRILQSPHPSLSEALITALRSCAFRAAETAGKAVAVKFLLGVPVTATE